MDFNTLTNGCTFYVLREGGEKPILHIGTFKNKQVQMQMLPNMQNQSLLTITATIDGHDVMYTDVPSNVAIAQKGCDTFTAQRELIVQAIDAMAQRAEKALSMQDYNKAAIEASENMRETLDPAYAEDKRQAKSIKALEQRQAETDKKLDNILSLLQKSLKDK